MKTVFVFGRDKQLSKLELVSFLKTNSSNYDVIYDSDEFLLVDLKSDLDLSYAMKRLAGTIKIGKVFYSSDKFYDRFLDNIDFYFPKNFDLYYDNLTSDISNENFEEVIKKYLKSSKLRGRVINATQKQIKASSKFNQNSESNCEVVVLKGKDEYYFAQISAYTDTSQFVYLDEERPIQKFTHGTSFRLARMMVNILGLEKGQTLVDPFCGIGTFLIEGLFAGLDVIGVDDDHKIVESSKQNLKWAEKTYKFINKYKILHDKAQTAGFYADGCVFEPYMGPFLRKFPTENEAKQIAVNLYNLYIQVFQNLSQNLSDSAKVVCIIPEFQTNKGDVVEVNHNFFTQTGFQIFDVAELANQIDLSNPVEYTTPDGSKIGRKVWILQKE